MLDSIHHQILRDNMLAVQAVCFPESKFEEFAIKDDHRVPIGYRCRVYRYEEKSLRGFLKWIFGKVVTTKTVLAEAVVTQSNPPKIEVKISPEVDRKVGEQAAKILLSR